jgi:hypothetical protein
MDKVNDFLINQNLRIKRLRERLNIEPAAEKKKEPDKEKEPKKKGRINKELTYMLIVSFVLCIVTFLYFCSTVYITIHPPDICNPFEGEGVNLDFANFK